MAFWTTLTLGCHIFFLVKIVFFSPFVGSFSARMSIFGMVS
jgi:hypothetical protein